MITFVIPSIGRASLNSAIISLKNQTISNWKAIIVFDGIKCNIDNYYINDSRIIVMESEKMGIGINSAGNVRNYAMSFVKTEWIAFLDDDDTIANDYIETFHKELNLYCEIDLLIFRMASENRIIPKLETDNFYLCDVGISFIMKKKIFDNNIVFIPDGAEDYIYLDTIRKNKYKMMISPYIKYYVRETVHNSTIELGNRVFINMANNLVTFIGYLFINKFFRQNSNIQ